MPHEWGVEYLLSFALGVTSSTVANAIYDLPKEQIPHYSEILMKITPSKPGDIGIDIKLDRPNGPLIIGVIERGISPTSISKSKIKKVIDEMYIGKQKRRKIKSVKKRK